MTTKREQQLKEGLRGLVALVSEFLSAGLMLYDVMWGKTPKDAPLDAKGEIDEVKVAASYGEGLYKLEQVKAIAERLLLNGEKTEIIEHELFRLNTLAFLKQLEQQQAEWKALAPRWEAALNVQDGDYDAAIELMAGSAMVDDPPKGWTKRDLARWCVGYIHAEAVQVGVNAANALRSTCNNFKRSVGLQ
jgi:hypothetical protein